MGVEDYDAELFDAIEDLVAEGELEKGTPAFGIAQQVIHQGFQSLSFNQRAVYNSTVVPALMRRDERLRAIHAMNSASP